MMVKEYTLKDLITIKNGRDYKNIESGNIPVYGTGGIMTYIKDYLYDGESILLPRKGSLDNIGYVNDKFWTVDTMYWSIVNKELAYPKYLYCYLRLLDLSCRDSGSTLPSMTFDSYYTLKINLPSMEIQKKIGDFIFSIIYKIEKNNKIIFELNSMAKTIYDYWFLQYEFPNEKGNPYKSSGGKLIYNEKLRRNIPEEWNTGNLYDIADFINGIACQKFRPNKEEKTLPVIKIKEMHNGITEDTERVRENIPKDNTIEAGDILFSWSATLEVMKWYGIKGALNQHIFKVIPKKYGINYTYMQLSQYIINFVLMAEARKTTMGHITTDHIKQSKIVLPTSTITDKFEKETNSIFNKILQCQKENEELTKLKDELLPLLINGQVGFKN